MKLLRLASVEGLRSKDDVHIVESPLMTLLPPSPLNRLAARDVSTRLAIIVENDISNEASSLRRRLCPSKVIQLGRHKAGARADWQWEDTKVES